MNESPEARRERLEQEAIAWQARLTSQDPSAEHRAEFEAWRAQSPQHAEAYRKIARLWQMLNAPLVADRQRRQATVRRTHSIRRHAVGWAAAAALVLAVGVLVYPDYLRHPLADHRTHLGEQSSIVLDDGSTLHLNTDTALDVRYSAGERKIVLWHGEAEFEVAHDAGRPFRVEAGTTTTEALGTRFVVRYDGHAGAVTLLQGKIRATTESPRATAELRPGQRLAFDSAGLSLPQAVDIGSADAWRRGRLVMNFAPLGEVVAELNRYRRGRVHIMDATLARREINATIDLAHIDAWLDALSRTVPVRVRRAGPWVLL